MKNSANIYTNLSLYMTKTSVMYRSNLSRTMVAGIICIAMQLATTSAYSCSLGNVCWSSKDCGGGSCKCQGMVCVGFKKK